MLLPYKVKNPYKRFPAATIALIAINVLVYMCTTDSFIFIREDIVKNYGYAFGASPFFNFFSAAFLHADPFHLLGNMLFLWIFGPPVEDRLGVVKFLAVYILTGFAGDVLQGTLDVAFIGKAQLGIGASGCIMGILGAYLYAFSWSTVCVFYWIYIRWHGVWEVAAIWIIGLYLLMDLGEGILFGSIGGGGVANFAHVGGGVAGAALCFVMRIKRDSEAVSGAKAIQADLKDLSAVPFHALETMLDEDPDNPDLLRAIIEPAFKWNKMDVANDAMKKLGAGFIDKDPAYVAYFLLSLRGDYSFYQPVHMLRLAGNLERNRDLLQAIEVYRLISERYPDSPDVEMALYKMAQCYWNGFRNAKGASGCLDELAKRFPRGNMVPFAKTMYQQIRQQAGSAN